MIIISPAKNLNILPEKASLKLSEPFFVNDTNSLVSKLKKLKFDNLKKLMKISDSLTELNLQRFQDFNSYDNVFKPAGFLLVVIPSTDYQLDHYQKACSHQLNKD